MDASRFITVVQGLAVIVCAALVAFVLFRSKTSKLFREERDAYKEKSDRVQVDLTKCLAESVKKDVVIAELQARTDLTDLRANQAAGMAMIVQIDSTLLAIAKTMAAMEKRLDQGLIMGKQ